jgi:uncharacterized protein YciW
VLTLTPARVTEPELAAMRHAGLDDGRILEVNQIAAYFAYENRMALGLGLETGSVLGFECAAPASMRG